MDLKPSNFDPRAIADELISLTKAPVAFYGVHHSLSEYGMQQICCKLQGLEMLSAWGELKAGCGTSNE